MDNTISAALFGVIGIALGGGIRALEAHFARKHEAKAVLSAICAEVEAINRLANHRQFLAAFQLARGLNANMVDRGEGEAAGQWLVLNLSQNYFSTFDALNSKLGLLDPYFADRIARFYTYAKAVTENYRPESPFQEHVTAKAAVEAFDNDIILLQTVHVLGVHIATFRKVEAPAGITNPFPEIAAAQSSVSENSLPNAAEPQPPQITDSEIEIRE